ncbi:MAG: HPr family phosphocarrier protein [Anaerobutyricum sp.]
MITRKIKIETISKVKDFVQDVSKVDVNADLSNLTDDMLLDAKSILGILSLDISHVMNLTIYDDEKNVGKYEKIFEKYGVKDNN